MLWPEREDAVWRLLLADAASPGPAQDQAVALIRRSLNFQQPAGAVRDTLHPRIMALDGLRQLLIVVGNRDNSDAYKHLQKLLYAYRTEISDSPHDIERFRVKMERWGDARDAAPELFHILQSM
jgi:hypothetical protein